MANIKREVGTINGQFGEKLHLGIATHNREFIYTECGLRNMESSRFIPLRADRKRSAQVTCKSCLISVRNYERTVERHAEITAVADRKAEIQKQISALVAELADLG